MLAIDSPSFHFPYELHRIFIMKGSFFSTGSRSSILLRELSLHRACTDGSNYSAQIVKNNNCSTLPEGVQLLQLLLVFKLYCILDTTHVIMSAFA